MIRVLAVGKIKEEYVSLLIDDYLKRINKYHKLDIIIIPDSDIKKEGRLILKNINEKDYVITLELDGVMFNSKEFSDYLDKLFIVRSNVVFVIGGSNGIDNDVKKRSDFKLSFSKMTFPHQLFRGILLEQIYRCFKIINNETYHK